MKKIIHFIIISFLLLNVACESESETIESPLKDRSLNGVWIVKAYIENKELFGPFSIETQLTPENDSIIINDTKTFWGFQVKVETKNSNNTFETESSINELSKVGANINVMGGQIIGKDSIFFDMQFEDDENPFGITYQIKGHRK
ncbi:MAG: lipid-binding protein [Dysgonamonadaceae bacterium]|nr:lipid-binding protein [Dysgonamonadaceae bacterium]